MNKVVILIISLSLVFFSCNNNAKKVPQTDIETATTFIRDILDNDLPGAEQYLLVDEANRQYFDIIKQQYTRKNKEELENYKKAEIIINETSYVADSLSIINYSNTYKPESKNKLKMVRINGKWLVDLKYTFSGNM
jgi:hypothetical protein